LETSGLLNVVNPIVDEDFRTGLLKPKVLAKFIEAFEDGIRLRYFCLIYYYVKSANALASSLYDLLGSELLF